MITDTGAGQTNYCPNCEDQARRIEELERHNRMLVDILRHADEACHWTNGWKKKIQDAINATPSHSAAWEWNQHVEFERVTNLFIKWYVSEREARFVFPTIAARDEFVEYMIGSKVFAIPELKEVKE